MATFWLVRQWQYALSFTTASAVAAAGGGGGGWSYHLVWPFAAPSTYSTAPPPPHQSPPLQPSAPTPTAPPPSHQSPPPRLPAPTPTAPPPHFPPCPVQPPRLVSRFPHTKHARPTCTIAPFMYIRGTRPAYMHNCPNYLCTCSRTEKNSEDRPKNGTRPIAELQPRGAPRGRPTPLAGLSGLHGGHLNANIC